MPTSPSTACADEASCHGRIFISPSVPGQVELGEVRAVYWVGGGIAGAAGVIAVVRPGGIGSGHLAPSNPGWRLEASRLG
jgi:hypothetical protein